MGLFATQKEWGRERERELTRYCMEQPSPAALPYGSVKDFPYQTVPTSPASLLLFLEHRKEIPKLLY